MLNRHTKEMAQAIDADEAGNGFVFDMFNYELTNHEYGYTHEVDDTLEALNLTAKGIKNNPKLFSGLQKACKYQRNQ